MLGNIAVNTWLFRALWHYVFLRNLLCDGISFLVLIGNSSETKLYIRELAVWGKHYSVPHGNARKAAFVE